MNDLRIAAQRALEALEDIGGEWGFTSQRTLPKRMDAITALRAALAEEEKAAAWLAERKEHWRKEKEKAQATKNHDPELSAALGWPGGISDPVLDRTQLLQMVAEMRVAAQQPEPVIDKSMAKRIATQLGWVPQQPAPPRCPNCASLEEQNAELDRKLAELERAEPVATTQQPVEQTPPSEYRRGYWDGFAVGKREGRIEAEDAAKRAEHNPTCALLQIPSRECDCSAEMAPVQRPMHPELRKMWEDYFDKCFRAMPAPPQRKPLALTDLQEALVLTNLIDRDAIDNPEEYDDGTTLAQIDELHSIITELLNPR